MFPLTSTKTTPPVGAFLVGCPRSGTTVLQSHLGRHPGVVTFPESHFFDCMLRGPGRLRGVVGLAKPAAITNLESFAGQIGYSGLPDLSAKRLVSTRKLTLLFTTLLTDSAQAAGASVWVEKTPGHSRYIPFIAAQIPGSKFIHLIRDGVEVVASLYRVTRQYPQHWSGEWPLEMCIRRWKSAIEDSRRHCTNRDRHFILFYDDLLADPTTWLGALLEFLELPSDAQIFSSMLSCDEHNASHINAFETWKTGAVQALAPPWLTVHKSCLRRLKVNTCNER